MDAVDVNAWIIEEPVRTGPLWQRQPVWTKAVDTPLYSTNSQARSEAEEILHAWDQPHRYIIKTDTAATWYGTRNDAPTLPFGIPVPAPIIDQIAAFRTRRFDDALLRIRRLTIERNG